MSIHVATNPQVLVQPRTGQTEGHASHDREQKLGESTDRGTSVERSCPGASLSLASIAESTPLCSTMLM